MKTCTSCKEDKPPAEFAKRAASKDGLASYCKICKRAYDNAHYKAHPERRAYIRANSDKRIQKVRVWVLQYLQEHPCVDCGEDDVVVLEFDHRGDKENLISQLMFNGTLTTVQKEVAKCDVRCANCHRRKTAKDFSWWKHLAQPVALV